MIVPNTISDVDLSDAGRVKYQIVADSLKADIDRGVLLPGARLPPVRDLAYQLGVTPGTVARAYTVLSDAGYLTAGVGRGTFVAERRAPSKPALADFTPYRHPSEGEIVSLVSPRLPDTGQIAILRAGMAALAEGFTDEAFLRYPSRLTETAACEAYAHEMRNAMVGPLTAEDVVLSNGGQNGVLLVMQTVLQGPDPVVLVDELAYSGFVRSAELCRATVLGVPWDVEGPDATVFAELVRAHKPQLFCTSSEVSNPLVRPTTLRRRAEIADIARRYGVQVLDDDVYRLAEHRGQSYRALLPDLGWHVGSPSKSISPAFRIGFVAAPQGKREALRRTAGFSAFAVSRLVSDLYAFAMAHPDMAESRIKIHDWVRRDVRAIVNALGQYQLAWDPHVPFVWLDLPEGWRAGEFCQAAEVEGVILKSAEDFALRDSRRVHGVRLALNGSIGPEQLVQAMDRLRELLSRPPQRISV